MSQGHAIAYCAVGNGRFYKSSFKESLLNRIKLEFPDAELEDSFRIPWEEVNLLRQGVDAYLKIRKPISGRDT